MENFFIEYRDPILGLIALIGAIFIIAFSSYVWGIFSKEEEKHHIKNFIKKFESSEDLGDKHKKLLRELDINIDSLAFLAETFSKSGDFSKAINVYLIALEKASKKDEKEFIYTSLGKIYSKSGFFRRANDVFFEALKLNPRNKDALKCSIVVYEKLREYKEELEILDVLQEQNVNVQKELSFTKSQIILNNMHLSFEQKVQEISNLKGGDSQRLRLILELFIKNKEPLSNIKQFPDLVYCIDIIWQLKEPVNLENDEYAALFYAKGLSDIYKKSSFFEVNAFAAMQKSNFKDGELNFKYVCQSCRNIVPIFFYRCPICYKLENPKIIISIVNKNNEDDISLQ